MRVTNDHKADDIFDDGNVLKYIKKYSLQIIEKTIIIFIQAEIGMNAMNWL